MLLQNIKYKDYFTLEDRSEYDFAIKYCKAEDVFNVGDFIELPFGIVKDMQYHVTNGLTFETFIEYFTKLTKVDVKDVYLFDLFKFHKHVISELEKIYDIENRSLSSEPTDLELRAGIENFSKYGYYSQFRQIMITFGISEQQVYDMPYNKVFMELLYQKDLNDFHSRYSKISMSK
jgi:hypothetical protein